MTVQFQFEENFVMSLPKPDLSKIEQRQELINKFLAKKDVIDSYVSEFTEFIQLENMTFNVTEQVDLADICDKIRVSLGCINQAWDDAYAFDQRIQDEKLLEKENQ